MTKTKRRNSEVADDYMDLVRRFPLRPIRSQSDYVIAAGILAGLVGRADAGLTPGESDYADTLTRLVAEYDQQHSSVIKTGKASPIEVLKFLLVQHGMNTVSLGKLVGGSGQASMILNGKRELSKANIRALADRFHVSPAVFFE